MEDGRVEDERVVGRVGMWRVEMCLGGWGGGGGGR